MFKWLMRLLSAAVVAVVVFGLWARKHYAAPSDTARSDTLSSSVSSPVNVGAAACGSPVLLDQSIGNLRIGASVDSVKKQCRVVRDTTQLGGEGMLERTITVAFPAGLIEAEIMNERVGRIRVESPAFRTPDSLGVGSSISEILRLDDPTGGFGEGDFYVISRKHCGLSYRVTGGRIPAGSNRRWDRKTLSELPASIKVDQVLVYKCHPPFPGDASD
jgi:hypothetical protein